MVKLIIVDDHFHVRQAWSWVLNQVPRMEVIAQCANGQEAIDAAKKITTGCHPHGYSYAACQRDRGNPHDPLSSHLKSRSSASLYRQSGLM